MAQCENEIGNVMTSSVIHDGETKNRLLIAIIPRHEW